MTVESSRLTAQTIRDAIEQVRAHTGYRPAEMEPMSPAAHDAANDLLGRPHGTDITRADLARAQQELYDRCTPEERERLVALALGWQP